MDFHQLLKRASANQSYTQKKHEQKKKQQEEEKKREEEERRERVRKASAALQDMKKASEKKERVYRGIVNSRAAEYEKAAARSSSSASDHGKTDLNRTTPSNGRPHPLATTSGKQTSGSSGKKSAECSQTTKGKTKISSAPTSSSKSLAVTSTSKSPKSLPASKSSSSACGSKPSSSGVATSSGVSSSSKSTVASKSAASSAAVRGSGAPKAPVNFQELMKLAEKKKSGQQVSESGVGGRRGDVAASGPSRTTDIKSVERRGQEKVLGGRRSRSGSPLGKLLLEKSSARGRGKNGLGGSGREVGGDEKKGSGVSESGSRVGQETGSSDRLAAGRKLKELAQSRVVSRGGGRGGKDVSGRAPQRLPESALLMRERFRRELEASASGDSKTAGNAKTTTKPSAKSDSFYASSHAELSKEGRPRVVNKRVGFGAGPYQSSWVSEMNEYVEQLREGGGEGYSEEEEEEEDGLDDFVVDDEEGDDVSSAIREIFGYDKRRYRDEDDDDRMMESSFAQQQYEEMRSSRIGRQEDEEDMKRENERLSRKKRKRGGAGGPSMSRGSKQTKLSFR